MKKLKLLVTLLSLTTVINAQNSYGEFGYSHSDPYELSCGIPATLTSDPGFVLAGFNNGSSNFNFCADRMDMGGLFTGQPWEFQKEYQIFCDATTNCLMGSAAQITSCHGVSIIQTQVPIAATAAAYAVAASFDEGCMVGFLNLNGSPINSNIFYFRFPNTNSITKPMILEDPNNLGNYFVCGSYNSIMYALYTDVTGATTWNNTYAISGEPNAITLSPSGDLVIVGRTDINGTDDDGFFIELAALNGTISVFETYDYNSYDQSLSCISPAVGIQPGYVIGGTCGMGGSSDLAYNLYAATTGSIVWDNRFVMNSDITAGNIVGIVERQSTQYGFEYFGVMSSTAGIIVVRMNNLGVPTFTGWGARLDDIVFDAPGTALQATDISFFDGTGYDEGLHVYGTNLNAGSMGFLAKSYFSGHDGCNSPAFHRLSYSMFSTNTSQLINPASGLQICNAIYLTENSGGTHHTFCGPNSSVSGGSNAKPNYTGLESENNENSYSISPNPANDFLRITCPNVNDINNIIIHDALGRVVFDEPTNKLNNVTNVTVVDLSMLSLENGFYNVTLETTSGPVLRKIVLQN